MFLIPYSQLKLKSLVIGLTIFCILGLDNGPSEQNPLITSTDIIAVFFGEGQISVMIPMEEHPPIASDIIKIDGDKWSLVKSR